MDKQPVLIFFLALAASIVIYMLIRKYNKERTKATQSIALQRGFRFTEKGDEPFIQEGAPYYDVIASPPKFATGSWPS